MFRQLCFSLLLAFPSPVKDGNEFSYCIFIFRFESAVYTDPTFFEMTCQKVVKSRWQKFSPQSFEMSFTYFAQLSL